MAWEITPSVKWQKILDMTDENEQGRAATIYVSELELKNRKLEAENRKLREKLSNKNPVSSDDNSGWECPSWYTDEQRRCFYGNFS